MISDERLSLLTRALFDEFRDLDQISKITGLSQGQLSKCQVLPGEGRETSTLSLKALIRLEEQINKPVVTGAIADHIRNLAPPPQKPLLDEACELTEAAADLQKAVRAASDRLIPRDIHALHAMLDKIERELSDVRQALPGTGSVSPIRAGV
jgi:hypothetical protein